MKNKSTTSVTRQQKITPNKVQEPQEDSLNCMHLKTYKAWIHLTTLEGKEAAGEKQFMSGLPEKLRSARLHAIQHAYHIMEI